MSITPIRYSFPFHSSGFQPNVNGLLRLDNQRVVSVRDITHDVRATIEEENRKARVELIDSATQLPTELVDIIESYLNDLPQAPRKPGAKAEQPLAITELPTPVRVLSFVNSFFKFNG